LPLLLIKSDTLAVIFMTVTTLLILFAVGWYRGNLLLGVHRIRDGIEVAGLGLLIIAAGAGSGWVLSHLV
jgi:VIT1/CCC1 family predicted Fe2+/Mn2+ transporter